MGKRRGQGEGREDQFGELGGSQDKHQFSGFNSGRGLTGGGSAGGTRKGGDVSYQRQVPKFLQRYSHLLGKTAADEDEPVVVGGPKGAKPDDEEEDDDQQEDNLEVVSSRWVVYAPCRLQEEGAGRGGGGGKVWGLGGDSTLQGAPPLQRLELS